MADLGSILGSAGIGGAIGKAIVSLELDTKKYASEMSAAEAKTTSSANSMSSGLASFKNIAAGAFAGAAAGVVAFAASSVKAALEANEAQLKLQNTFANNPRLADSSVEAFTRQADALRDLTGVDDEAIISAQSLLGQFKLTGSQVMTLTPLIVDLSEKMGVSLEAAAKAVGKATQGSTGALSRYGVIIADTDTKAEAFTATVKGLGVAQGFAADQAEAEPWRVLGAQVEELQETVGQALIPVLQGVVPVLKDVVKILSFATGATEGFDRAVQEATLHLSHFELGIASFFEKFGGHIPFISQAVDLWDRYTQVQDAARASTSLTQEQIDTLTLGIQSQDPTYVAFRDHWTQIFDTFLGGSGKVDAANTAIDQGRAYLEHFLGIAPEVTAEVVEMSNKIPKAFRDTRDALKEEIPAIRGTTETWKETFTLSPAELVKITDSWARIAKTIAHDLRVIGDSDLQPAVREAIAALPPEMRHAWVEGNAKQRQAIVDDIKRTFKVEDQIPGLARQALEGGQRIGASMDQGLIKGIVEGSPAVSAAAADAVRRAIAQANEAAGAHSPSRRMAELGVDMMVGLANGISSAEQKAIDAAKKAIQKSIDAVSSVLDKVRSQASGFRGGITGGFSGFSDIAGAFGSAEAGTPLSGIISAQVGGAQTLAFVLSELKRAGAGKALLGQAAGNLDFGAALLAGGPQQIAEANDALKTIAELSRETGKALSEAFFGERIDKLELQLKGVREDLHELARIEREGHDIVVDGQKLGETTRRELIKTGRRNPGTGIT